MNIKKLIFGFIVLSFFLISIFGVSAVENNTADFITSSDENAVINIEENNSEIKANENDELIELSNDSDLIQQSNEEDVLESGEIERIHFDNEYDNENYYDYSLNYKGKNIVVEFYKNEINQVKNGQIITKNTGITMNVPIIKFITKTTTKKVKTKIWAWKYYKNKKKIKWNKKYISKTFKNAKKKGKFIKSYSKKTKYGKIFYQVWKIPKKTKKTVKKKVYQNKQIKAELFKSTGGQYPAGYWISLGYSGADIEGWTSYKIAL